MEGAYPIPYPRTPIPIPTNTMAPKEDWEKYEKKVDDKQEEKIVALDDQDIQILKTYGQGPYSLALKKIDQELKDIQKRIDEKLGVKESDTGLAPPNLWDLQADKQRMGEHTLNVARCSKIIKAGETKPGAGAVPVPAQATNPQDGGGGGNPEGDKYVINIRQHAKYVVGLDENVAPTDVEGPPLLSSRPPSTRADVPLLLDRGHARRRRSHKL